MNSENATLFYRRFPHPDCGNFFTIKHSSLHIYICNVRTVLCDFANKHFPRSRMFWFLSLWCGRLLNTTTLNGTNNEASFLGRRLWLNIIFNQNQFRSATSTRTTKIVFLVWCELNWLVSRSSRIVVCVSRVGTVLWIVVVQTRTGTERVHHNSIQFGMWLALAQLQLNAQSTMNNHNQSHTNHVRKL